MPRGCRGLGQAASTAGPLACACRESSESGGLQLVASSPPPPPHTTQEATAPPQALAAASTHLDSWKASTATSASWSCTTACRSCTRSRSSCIGRGGGRRRVRPTEGAWSSGGDAALLAPPPALSLSASTVSLCPVLVWAGPTVTNLPCPPSWCRCSPSAALSLLDAAALLASRASSSPSAGLPASRACAAPWAADACTRRAIMVRMQGWGGAARAAITLIDLGVLESEIAGKAGGNKTHGRHSL